jgi:hypothetical protein
MSLNEIVALGDHLNVSAARVSDVRLASEG